MRLTPYSHYWRLALYGPVYNIYLSAEISEIDPQQYLLQVSVPASETRRESSRRLHHQA